MVAELLVEHGFAGGKSPAERHFNILLVVYSYDFWKMIESSSEGAAVSVANSWLLKVLENMLFILFVYFIHSIFCGPEAPLTLLTSHITVPDFVNIFQIYYAILFVAKHQEAQAHVCSHSDHDVGCCHNLSVGVFVCLGRHRQWSLRQHSPRWRKDFARGVCLFIPPADVTDDFLLFSHCLCITIQGNVIHHHSRSEF